MVALLRRFCRGSLTRCGGLLWKTLNTTTTTATTAIPANTTLIHYLQTNSNQHYLRSRPSILCHYYKSQTIEDSKTFFYHFEEANRVPKSQLNRMFKLIKNDGFPWEEVEKCKDVLLIHPEHYMQRVHLLHRLSISKPSLFLIMGIVIMMESSVVGLQEKFGSTVPSNLVERLLEIGRSDLGLSDSVVGSAGELAATGEHVTVKDLFLFLLKHYLAIRFSEDVDEVGSFLEDAQFPIFLRPLHDFPDICDVLIEGFQYSFSEVQEDPRLFDINSQNARELLTRFPDIGDVHIREVAKNHPGLLRIPASRLERWLHLLHQYHAHKFKFTQDAVAVFKTTAFSVAEEKLRILSQMTEWEIIVVSGKVFEILNSNRSVKMLINAVESGQGVSNLGSVINASKYLKQRRLRVPPEIVTYVASMLDVPEEEAKEMLKENIYTFHGLANTKAVLRLLLDYGFTHEQVLVGLTALNMKVEVVERTLKDLHKRPEAQPFSEWLENPYILHLLVYCIKKDLPELEGPYRC